MTSQKFISARFGELQFEEQDTIVFDGGLPGFPDCQTFLVLQHREGSPFRWLQSLDIAEIAFLVTDPANFVPDFAPPLRSEDAQGLCLNSESPRLVYTIVTIPKGKPEEMTMNLAGPIIINVETRKAKQVILDDQAYSIKHRLEIKAKESSAAA